MDDKKKKNEESLSRRSFLASLGKWSSIVVATAVLGISEASASDEVPKEAGAAQGGIPGEGAHDESVESQWWWGRRRRGCRVWGNAGCRVWGNAGGCRVWGNR